MSEIEYNKFFDISNQAMIVVDMDGYFLKANIHFCNLIGYTENELKKLTFWDLLFDKDFNITEKESDQVKKGKISESFVNRYKRKNGRIAYMEWYSYPDIENNRTYAIGRDITDFLFNDSILQEVAHSIPGTIFKIKKTENGTFKFAFSNQKLIGLFSETKLTENFLDFLNTLTDESQFIFLRELDNAERDMKFKSFNIYLKEHPNIIYQVNLNPFKEDRKIVFYGISTKISNNYIQKPLDKNRFKNQILNKNQGFYSFTFEDFDLTSNFNEKFNSYLNGTVAECNEMFASIYGLTKKEIIEQKVENLNANIDDIKSFLKKLELNNYNLINNISYDEINDVYYISNVSCYIENGHLIQLIGCFEDISSQLLKQKQLEISELNYKQIFENSPIGIIIHDEEKILKANNFAFSILETNELDLIGKNPLDIVHSNYKELIKERQNNILIRGEKYNSPIVCKFKNKSNKSKYVQVAGHYINYFNKPCVEVVFIDVSEKLILEEENEKYRHLFESILDNTTDYITRLNSKGYFTYVNKPYLNKLGFDVIGKHYSYCLSSDQIEILDSEIEKLIQNPDKIHNVTLKKFDSNNKEFLVNWNLIAVYEKDDLYIQCIGTDITEINKTRYELEQANLRYKESAKLAKLAYWEYNPNSDEVYWDENMYKLLEFPEDTELSYEFSKSLVHPESLSDFYLNLDRAINLKETVYYDYKLKNANGYYLYVIGNIRPVLDNKGKLQKIVASLQDVTIQRQRDLELLKNKDIFEAIFKSVPIGINIQNKDDKIVLHNKESERILGLTEGQLLGKDSYDPRWNAKDENGEDIKINEFPSIITLQTGKPIRNFIMRVNKDDNSYSWIIINSEPASYDSEGNVETIVVSFMDITEIKELNDRLRSSLLLLNEMGSLSNTGAWEYDIKNNNLFWSDSMYEIYGVDKDYNIIPDVEERFYPKSEINKVKNDFETLLKSEKELDTRYNFIDANGNKKVIRYKAQISYFNNIKKIIGITQDITDFVEKELEIKNKSISLIQLKNAIDKSSIVSYTDANGKIIEVNQKFTEVYGYTKKEIINGSHKLLSSGFHTKEFWKNFWDTILAGNIWNGELCNKTKNGKIVWFYATIFPLKDSNGNILSFLEILIDITLKKKYEQELEEKVNYRTKELNETLLEKDFILQMVSHDLKNPLTGIILQSEILKKFAARDNIDYIIDKVNYILDCTSRMNIIIKNLLEFDTIEQDNKLLLKKTHLNEILKDVSKNYKEKLDKKNQILLIENNAISEYVLSHKNHLYQIIENIVSNASKFSEFNTSIKIKVDKYDNYILLSIEDEGPGISEFELSKIFQKFVKLSNKPTGDEVSSGLGLAIVKKLCDLLNHEIKVKSTLNIGTVFTIKLLVYSK